MDASGRIDIRPEKPEDWPAIADINDRAFSGTRESALIAAIRRTGRPMISLVALSGNAPVGHVLFSPLRIQLEGSAITALALAPMAVLPEFQGRGIGTRLAEAGLAACATRGCQVVVVVGHARFYRRFGFRAATDLRLDSVYAAAGDAFMAIELESGVLGGRTGFVEYPPEFAGV